MHIPTIEEDYEYRMKSIMENFISQYDELKDLDANELQDKLWSEEYATEFGRAVITDMSEFSGDELFEMETD